MRSAATGEDRPIDAGERVRAGTRRPETKDVGLSLGWRDSALLGGHLAQPPVRQGPAAPI
eukprot:scaffold19440_cov99-Isochrysis_galbana.AAC.4